MRASQASCGSTRRSSSTGRIWRDAVRDSNRASDGSATNFVYACADGTALFTNNYHSLSSTVTKVRRHVLFVRSKYWVIRDEFTAVTPCTFMVRWHVPWAFRYNASSSAQANEHAIPGSLYVSNSYARTTNGFTYVAGNHADSEVPSPSRVPVTVLFANATNTWNLFAATGTNSLGSSGTSQNGTSGTNSTLNPFISGGSTFSTVHPDRAVGLWITNTTSSTNFSFTWANVPQQNGVAAPTILRLDDNTVAVTYDGVTETNTFGTNYAGAFTYRVALAEAAAVRARPMACARCACRWGRGDNYMRKPVFNPEITWGHVMQAILMFGLVFGMWASGKVDKKESDMRITALERSYLKATEQVEKQASATRELSDAVIELSTVVGIARRGGGWRTLEPSGEQQQRKQPN